MRWVYVFMVSSVFLAVCCDSPGRPTPPRGTRVIDQNGYSGCIELFNDHTSVVLEPNCGGRVLIYSLNGRNVLHVDPRQDGWVYSPDKRPIDPCGGRFDIGPETITPKRYVLWIGRWDAEVTGPRSAKLTSQEDAGTGVRLRREFVLDEGSSHLRCTQTITNISDQTKRYCHWSRTFARGGGICLVPVNPQSRYPKGYLLYGPGSVMDYRPAEEPNIRVREGILEIIGPPSRAKFAVDSLAGWIAYLTRSDHLFVKRFPVFPDRPYGEMAGNSVSIWYMKDLVCEIEPIGPWETIEPGKSASFAEDWWLFDYTYPEDKRVDLGELQAFIQGRAPRR